MCYVNPWNNAQRSDHSFHCTKYFSRAKYLSPATETTCQKIQAEHLQHVISPSVVPQRAHPYVWQHRYFMHLVEHHISSIWRRGEAPTSTLARQPESVLTPLQGHALVHQPHQDLKTSCMARSRLCLLCPRFLQQLQVLDLHSQSCICCR
jgi:hypothetical protein